ncbi:MAG: hypothetical protein M9955_20145 [Rhizobiaceae bacterium]|nr:hypothetical protein [Rhizobiaceae bacterium]
MPAVTMLPNIKNMGAIAYRVIEDEIAKAAGMSVPALYAAFVMATRVWSAADRDELNTDAEPGRLLDAATNGHIALARMLAYAPAGTLAELRMKQAALHHLEITALDEDAAEMLRTSIEADNERLVKPRH